MRYFQARGEGLIPVGVEIGKDISLQRSLSIGYTPEVMNRLIDTSVIESNNIWRKRYIWIRVHKGLIMVDTYTHV